ncbi:MAG: TlpA family protein disulfide reductase [Caldimonas sp.]
MKRRALVIGAVVSGGIAAGAGTFWWRARSGEPAEEAIDIWSLSFATLEGKPLAMDTLRGKPLIVNFWATWCAPCVIEMPLLDAFSRSRARDVNVLALAIDSAEPVRRFIADKALHLPVALAGDVGLALARQLGNIAGGLPFSVLFDAAGRPVQRRLGAVDVRLLEGWAASGK